MTPRLTDNDRTFCRFITYGRSSWRALRLVWSSGGDGDDERTRNTLTFYVFGWVVQIPLPNLLQPYRIRHEANWDAAAVLRLGRNHYFETHPREYGFSLSDGFLQLFFGAQTHDSTTTQDWGYFLPWTQWRHVRFSLYTPDGTHFWTQYETERKAGIGGFEEQYAAAGRCPKMQFLIDDYDGERITATTHLEEREWRFGTGWFKWLSWFRRPKIRRSLDIRFDKETGPEKGSWKGGTLGHGIDVLPGELHEAAFRRYCDQEHRSKYRNYRVTFVSAV